MEDFRAGFTDLLHNIAVNAALDKFQHIIPLVESVKASFGKELAMRGVDVPQNPFDYSGDWVELSQNWLKRKGASSGNPRFYYGLGNEGGHLQDALFAMPTERLFGKTQLTTRTEAVTTTGFYSPALKLQIDTVYRNSRGQFVSRSSYEQNKKAIRITIKPFPSMSSGFENYEIARQLPISLQNRRKLLYNDNQRPLIENFTEWFYKNKIKFVIEEALKGMQ